MTLTTAAPKSAPHIAIFNCAEHGHVNPTLGMVKELVKRGYRVSYTTSAEFAPLIRDCGAVPVLFTPTFSKEKPRPQSMTHVVIELAKEASQTCQPLYSAFAGDRPDIIAYGPLSWLGKIFASLWDIPAVALNPTHVAYPGQSEEWLGISAHEWPSLPILDAMLRRNGLALDLKRVLSRADPVLAFIPRLFQEKSDAIDPAAVFAGPEIISRPLPPDWQQVRKTAPLMIISLGSVYTDRLDFFRSCIAAFADSEYQVMLCVGRYVNPAALGPIAENISLHPHIPQLALLQQADLFITHAGMNSVMEAAHFGVPVIAVPQQAEQRLNARRVRQLGLGLCLLPEEASAARLLAAAREIAATPAFHSAIAQFQQALRAAGGARAAADLFDRVLASRSLPLAAGNQ